MNKRKLIIMLNNLGDVLMASSVFNLALKSNEDVYFLVDDSHKELFEVNGRVLFYPRKKIQNLYKETGYFPLTEVKEFVNHIKSLDFHEIINLFQGNDSAILSRMLVDDSTKIKGKFIDYDGIFKIEDDFTKYLYSIAFQREYNNLHVIDIFKRIYYQTHSIESDFVSPKVFYTYNKDIKKMFNLPEKYILIHHSTAWPSKTYNRFDEVADILTQNDYNVVLTGIEKEKEYGNKIVEKVSKKEKIYNLTGKTSKIEYVELIKNAEMVISGDTVAIHVASAFSKPTIAIFSASNFIETGPYNTNAFIIKSTSDKYKYGSFEKTTTDGINNIEPMIVANLAMGIITDFQKYKNDVYIYKTDWEGNKLIYKNLTNNDFRANDSIINKVYRAFFYDGELLEYENEYKKQINELKENLKQFKKHAFSGNKALIEELNNKINALEKEIENWPPELQLLVRWYRFTVNSLPQYNFLDGYLKSLDKFEIKVSYFFAS